MKYRSMIHRVAVLLLCLVQVGRTVAAQGPSVPPPPSMMPVPVQVPPAISTPAAPTPAAPAVKAPPVTPVAPAPTIKAPTPEVKPAPGAMAPMAAPGISVTPQPMAMPAPVSIPVSQVVPAPTMAPVQPQPIIAPVVSMPAPQPTPPSVTPAKPVEKKKPEGEEPINVGPGVDTIDIESGGNWLQKRVIWEDAQHKYEKIKELLSRVFDTRMSFFDKRAETDKELNLFFVDIGFAQGELDEIIDTLLATVEIDRKQQGSLSEQERDVRNKLQEKKKELEQLKADVKSISELDSALDDALSQLLKQINLCVSYEKQSWQKFKNIGQELNDKKARAEYAYMDAAQKNIEAIAEYIQGPFNQYYSSVLDKIHEYMNSVKSRLEEIKNSGIELKKKLTDIEESVHKEEKEKEEAAKKAAAAKKKITWYSYLLTPFAWISDHVASFFEWIMSWFSGPAKKK